MSQDGWKDAGVETIGRYSPWLRDVLVGFEVGLHPGSRLAVALDRSESFREEVLARQSVTLRGPDPMNQFLETFFDVSGVDYLAKALHRGMTHGVAPRFKDAQALVTENPILTEPHAKSGMGRNTTWEYLLACLLAPVADNVVRDEPDVVCDFEGIRYGLAAKVQYGENPRKLVRDAADQIERANVDRGFIMLNLVERFPHRPMLDMLSAANLKASGVVEIIDGWNSAYNVTTRLKDSLRGKTLTKVHAIMAYIPTIAFADSQPMPWYRFYVMPGNRLDDTDRRFILALHKSSQSVPFWCGGEGALRSS